MADILWFTSTTSVSMHGKTATFPGLYECQLDRESGTCENPLLVVDTWNHNDEHQRGLDLMNVEMDDVNSMVYSEFYNGERQSFEILRAPLESPVKFESFFRVGQESSYTTWNGKNCLMKCCEGAGRSYYQVIPRDYVVDGDEVFVSWDGFYQDCNDEFFYKKGLLWTIGVSKILQTAECVSTGGLEDVNFAECTTPAAIIYQHGIARHELLGYSGFALSLSPAGNRVFFLSVLTDRLDSDRTPKLTSEVWLMPEGGNYAKDPKTMERFGEVEIGVDFKMEPIDDVGTIVLRLDENRVPTALCRTAYNAGVFCYSLSMGGQGIIVITGKETFVTAEQVAESCTLPKLDHFPITKLLPPVSTGLEVIWDEGSPVNIADMVFFGCYGEINTHGNFSTAFRNGTVVQTLAGGYPGSILFGRDLGISEILHDHTPPPRPSPPAYPEPKHPGSQIVSFFLLVSLAVGLYVGQKFRSQRQEVSHYDLVLQADADVTIEFQDLGVREVATSEAKYIELSTQTETDPGRRDLV